MEDQWKPCSNIRFLETQQATAYDNNNQVVTCGQCSNPAGLVYWSPSGQVAFCSDHNPDKDKYKSATFVYNPPKDLKPIVNDMWTIDLRKDNNE